METVTVEGRDGKSADIHGVLLVPPVTTYSDDKDRWAEFRMYRREGGGYTVHRAGMSLVYHQLDGPCRTKDGSPSGHVKKAGELPDNAVSCDACRPPYPEELRPDEEVRFEEPRHTINHCADAKEAVDALTWDPKNHRRSWTAPVSDLIMACARVEPEFAAVGKSPTIKL